MIPDVDLMSLLETNEILKIFKEYIPQDNKNLDSKTMLIESEKNYFKFVYPEFKQTIRSKIELIKS